MQLNESDMKEVAELLCDRIILRNILKSNTPEVQSETKVHS